MSKNPPLSESVKQSAARAHRSGEPDAGRAGSSATTPGRAGKVNVTGYFDPSVKAQLLRIRAKYPERTMQDLLAEALNLLFAKHGVTEAAARRQR